MAQDFTLQGPYPVGGFTRKINLVPDDGATAIPLDAVVTYPTSGDAPYPVVFMFNGFQARAPWYTATVRHVASWGYVVVQYTHAGFFPIVVDRVELTYLTPLIAWLASLASEEGGPKPDMGRLATMGHSRGGKLAALHFATRSDIAAAVLLDPIDNTDRTPEGPDYPSAARALAAANKAAGLVGAGINGSCNPAGSNYPKFFASLAPGSWQMVVLQAGHMQFCRTGNAALDWGFDRLCGTGRIAAGDVIRDAASFAVAWLESRFRWQQAQAGLANFHKWVEGQADSQSITFTAKEAPFANVVAASGASAATVGGRGGEVLR